MSLDELWRALFWTLPFVFTVALSAFLFYLSRKDRDKRKIMFMLCFAFASVGYSNLMLMKFGIPTLWIDNYTWTFVPVTAAASIAIISSLLNLKDFDRPFKCFLFILGVSIVLLAFPNPDEVFRILFLGAFGLLCLPASMYLFAKKRDNSDLMFFLAFSCFIFSWISLEMDSAEEITVLLTLFGMVFTALMFTTTKGRIAGDMASFFTLQSELEKTREDLTQTQKRAFAELEESEERYKNLCENARVGILRMDLKGTVTYANRFINEYGLIRDDVVGKNMLKFIPMKNRPKMFMEHISVIRGNNAQGETEIISPKGKRIIEYVSNPVRHRAKIIGCETVMQDITDKKEMKRKLEEYAAQLETMVETRTLELEKSEEKLGVVVGQQASLMRSSAEMIHSSDVHQRLQAIVDAIQGLGWQRVILSLRNEELDISEPQDLVTAGLTDKEQEFIWTNRQSGRIWRERLGPEFERFKLGEFYYLPYSDPFVKKKFSKGVVFSHLKPEEMVDWDPDDLLYAPLRLADKRVVAMLSIDDPDDGRRPTKESLGPLELFLHQAAVAIENARLIKQLNEANGQIQEYAEGLEKKVQERTRELVDVQNMLLKSQRLAAIGELAGMVGHDLRNPLTGIAGATYYLKNKLIDRSNDREKEMFETIEKAIVYSNKIISDLLDYSREIHLEFSDTEPKLLLREALSFIQIPQNVEILDEIESEPLIKVDKEKMKRVFMNIIKNAFDAMPDGGVLTIRSAKEGKHASFSFTDTGAGISEKARGKLWTPLFTTKAKGMGFGLPICKRMVEAHGGTISAESTIGKGTTFKIIIPIEPGSEETEDVWVNLPEKTQLKKEDRLRQG